MEAPGKVRSLPRFSKNPMPMPRPASAGRSLLLLGSVFAACCSTAVAQPGPTLPGTTIQNWQVVGSRLYSGSQPTTDADFAELARRGVKAVVTVDGIAPDLKLAHKHGLRYVHIPIGYDALPQEAGDAMTHALRAIDGPIYVHCHHGMHRGPAMAAVAGRACGELTPEQAVEYLKRAGLSPKYEGLWRDVEAYVVPPADAELPPLMEQAPVKALAKRMAAMSRNVETLEGLFKSKDKLDADQWTEADSESLLAMEQFVEAQRELPDSQQAQRSDAKFLAELARAVEASKLLHEAARGHDRERSEAALALLKQACTDCHASYRD
jgi:protein tyrosine phosphatase (PTP) superfamily phosphohydrolase (DUF442 family)/cytochrome c556